MIKVDLKATNGFITDSRFEDYLSKAKKSKEILESRSGKGSEFLGWMNLPSSVDEHMFRSIEEVVSNWSAGIELIVVIGIGGSYLGAKSAIDALSHSFRAYFTDKNPQVVFAGQNLSEEYLSDLLDLMEKRSTAAVVISKSGTTTEPAVAFRIIKNYLVKKYGKSAKNRIIAITDSSKGALKRVSDIEGYNTFVIPDDVGGRFSVFTPVGLIPIALAGYDIRKLIQGAHDMQLLTQSDTDDPSIIYAAARNYFYDSGKKIELMVTYNPKLQYIAEWWKQLFGESEGKEGKGIFPASVNFTSDLHSMGQYIQQGERTLFETVVSVKQSSKSVIIEEDRDNHDGLNFLANKSVEECNKMAELGTKIAHFDGGVPTINLEIERLDEYSLGALYYFFEKACGISAYMLGVNPFDQPGVEEYKVNMFALLGKPDYKDKANELLDKFN